MPEHKTLSAPYEPLRPPEYKRNEVGQFSRSGKTLAKTQKKTGLNGSVAKNSTRFQPGQSGNPAGCFRPGQSGNPAGRKPGVPNKVTTALKDMILRSLDRVGGELYLQRLAIENSSAYASLLGKVLPTTLSTDESNGGMRAEIRFVREICWPDNRREIEGETPKSLPAPDASYALPKPTDPTDDTNQGAV
jgi:hypothetical protein